jgi:hypothetical protein
MVFLGTPAQKSGAMAEAASGKMIVLNFAYELG